MLRSTNVTFPRRNSFPVPKMVTIGESMMTDGGEEKEPTTETLPVPTLPYLSKSSVAFLGVGCGGVSLFFTNRQGSERLTAWESSIWNVRNKMIFNSPYPTPAACPSQCGYHMWMDPWLMVMPNDMRCGMRNTNGR